MTVDEMIEALQSERKEEARRLVEEGRFDNLTEALAQAGRMQVLQRRQGLAERVCVWGTKEYSERGHIRRGVYVGCSDY